MTSPAKVLLVDSSTAFLSIMEKIIDKQEITIVDRLNSGPEAITKMRETSPDIIIIDLDMPFMSGTEAIELIMATRPVPILATTAVQICDKEGILKKGALEVIEKSSIEKMSKYDFTKKIRFLAAVTVFAHYGNSSIHKADLSGSTYIESSYLSKKIISIASSTGGPRAISEILVSMPEDTPFPVVVAQHMPEGFIDGMIRWLNTISKIPVKVGETGERVVKGFVYFSPPEKHMIIDQDRCIVLENHAESDIFHPSCDRLLTSVAHVYGKNAIAVILTGMGNDGVNGMGKIKDYGGFTIAQDEESSLLFGMPKEAIASGCIDRIIPLNRIAAELQKHFVGPR